MKRQLFGYHRAEVDIILDALKQENENLNAAVIALKIDLAARQAELEKCKALVKRLEAGIEPQRGGTVNSVNKQDPL